MCFKDYSDACLKIRPIVTGESQINLIVDNVMETVYQSLGLQITNSGGNLFS
jgi:hypothetical protein